MCSEIMSGDTDDWSPDQEEETLKAISEQAKYVKGLEQEIQDLVVEPDDPIDILKFDLEAERILKENGIVVVSQLVDRTEKELRSLSGLTSELIAQVLEQLAKFYLTLK